MCGPTRWSTARAMSGSTSGGTPVTEDSCFCSCSWVLIPHRLRRAAQTHNKALHHHDSNTSTDKKNITHKKQHMNMQHISQRVRATMSKLHNVYGSNWMIDAFYKANSHKSMTTPHTITPQCQMPVGSNDIHSTPAATAKAPLSYERSELLCYLAETQEPSTRTWIFLVGLWKGRCQPPPYSLLLFPSPHAYVDGRRTRTR